MIKLIQVIISEGVDFYDCSIFIYFLKENNKVKINFSNICDYTIKTNNKNTNNSVNADKGNNFIKGIESFISIIKKIQKKEEIEEDTQVKCGCILF